MNPTTGIEGARSLLKTWLFRQLDEPTRNWLTSQIELATSTAGNQAFYKAFALIGRKLAKDRLYLTAQDSAAASQCIEGWMPGEWTLADAGRVKLLASLPEADPEFAPRFVALCQTAGVDEAISLYRGLPLYPQAEALEPQVGEGLRSNMRSVFEAIAHNNPYPRRVFTTHRWNHMVLKAVFVGSRLAPIQGLDERANAELARIMLDFVHERRAASREVPFEIWRCVGPFATGAMLQDIERALMVDDPRGQRAAALALKDSPDPRAASVLGRRPELGEEIASGRLTWEMLQ